MNVREEREMNTDQAWNNLYNRLEQEGLLPVNSAGKQQTISRSPALKWAVSVAALFVCVVLVFMIYKMNRQPGMDLLLLSNAKGEPTLITTFEDGSIIYLSEQASLEYPSHFGEDKREVSLKGDAFFEVSKNRERPFIIQTQTATIEVLGTSFNVLSKDNEEFSLSVRTGEVKVTSRKDNKSVYVKAGETALLRADKLQRLSTSDLDQFNRYLKYVYFKDQTLSDVARIVNENSDSIQLKVAPELGDRQITVTFRNSSPEDMAEIISRALGLQFTRQQNVISITQ